MSAACFLTLAPLLLLPCSFYHTPVPGWSDGYPLLADVHLTAKRAQEVLAAVQQGAYLSATLTQSLTAQLVAYNPDARVLGYWRVDMTWLDAGTIRAKIRVSALPAISYAEAFKNQRVRRVA